MLSVLTAWSSFEREGKAQRCRCDRALLMRSALLSCCFKQMIFVFTSRDVRATVIFCQNQPQTKRTRASAHAHANTPVHNPPADPGSVRPPPLIWRHQTPCFHILLLKLMYCTCPVGIYSLNHLSHLGELSSSQYGVSPPRDPIPGLCVAFVPPPLTSY